MITFFYVRHGTTKGNTEFRLIGNAESPLTETGIQNAEDAAKALIDILRYRGRKIPQKQF